MRLLETVGVRQEEIINQVHLVDVEEETLIQDLAQPEEAAHKVETVEPLHQEQD